MKHILIIPSWYPSSYNKLRGIFFQEQAEALAKNNELFVGLIAIQEISLKEILSESKIDFGVKKSVKNDVHSIVLQYPSIPKMPNLRAKINFTLFKIIFKQYVKENGLPDIIHLHSFLDGESAIWIKNNYNIPYVVTEHFSGFSRNLLNNFQLKLARRVFEASSYNIAVSPKFTLLLGKMFNLSFKHIPNGVNSDFFTIGNKEKNLTKFRFINIAFLDKNKNQEMLIKSFSLAFKNNKNVELLIVGSGIEYNNLSNLIQKLDLQDKITLYGKADRNKIRELLQSSRAFVLSSKYETFGVVIIEAMACGLPVISTKCEGPESIITDSGLGVLCDIDKKALAESMYELYYNINNYRAEYIREYIVSYYSHKAIVTRLISIYKEVIN